jgi:hypothetical protein
MSAGCQAGKPSRLFTELGGYPRASASARRAASSPPLLVRVWWTSQTQSRTYLQREGLNNRHTHAGPHPIRGFKPPSLAGGPTRMNREDMAAGLTLGTAPSQAPTSELVQRFSTDSPRPPPSGSPRLGGEPCPHLQVGRGVSVCGLVRDSVRRDGRIPAARSRAGTPHLSIARPRVPQCGCVM